jgi:DNA mismatch repair protein MutS
MCLQENFLTAQGNAEYIDKLLQNFDPSGGLIQKNNKNLGNLGG